MKRILNTLIIVLATQLLIAQSVADEPSAATPSASAGSFGKFVETPVNLHTGIPEVSIPIYTVSEGPLSLSLSLSYHAGGNRTTEVGSAVGLGWVLNAGGIITRAIRGVPDDKTSQDGYFYDGNTLTTNSSDIEDAAKRQIDSEPDIYSLFAPGLGALKFTYDANKNIRTFPHSKIKIQQKVSGCGTLTGFEVIGTDGTIYWFGQDPDQGQIPCNLIFQNSPLTYFENFHLERIISADERHSIDLEYANSDYEFKNLKPCKAYIRRNTNGSLNSDEKECADDYKDVTISVRDRVLESITTSTSTITVDHFERLDLERSTTIHNYLGQTSPTIPLGIDRINITEGSYQITYELSHGYFNDNIGEGRYKKRLRLDKVQLVSVNTPSLNEPPYKFDYYANGTFFPHRLTPRIDHWGFYNGATGNDSDKNLIPATTVSTSNGNVTYGSSDRNTSEANMMYGQLVKVSYPTQGWTEFEYEKNQFQDGTPFIIKPINNLATCDNIANTCCGTNNENQSLVLTSQMILSGELTLYLRAFVPFIDPCFQNINPWVSLDIYDVTGGNTLAYSTNLNSSISDDISIDLNTITGLVAGNNYSFEITSYYCRGRLDLAYTNDVTSTDCGGLRIKKVTTHDDISSTHNIVRNYKYQNAQDTTLTSGIIYNLPAYGFALEDGALFDESGIRPLAGFDGSHFGYEHVVTDYNGNGESDAVFYMDQPDGLYDDYPPIPPDFRPRQGVQETSKIFHENGTTLQTTKNYLDTITNLRQSVFGTRYAASDLSAFGALNNKYVHTIYFLYQDLLRPLQINKTTDGVTNSIRYTYPAATYHYQPNTVTAWNSDGKAFRTDYKYTSEYAHNTAIKDTFINRNIVAVPYQTLQRANSAVIGGSRTLYTLFNTAGNLGGGVGADPYPQYLQDYQRTWTNGILQSPSWSTERTITNYTADGLLKTTNGRGWSSTVYDYFSNKLLKSKTFQGHVNAYTYKSGTRLLDVSTAVDLTTTTYNYDDLMRLSSVTDNCNTAGTSYIYQFYNSPGSRSYIQTTNTYPADPSGRSDLTSTVNKAFMDGLGRTIETVKVAQTQDGLSDIIHAAEYDNQGRKWKTFEPYQLTSTGNYNNPYLQFQYGFSSYEPSPLNRPATQNHTDWHASTYEYGSNTSSDGIANIDGGGTFGVNTLMKSIIIDPNNNQLITFTDKRGRTVLTRRTNSTGGGAVDTYMLYDDKDRPTIVIPPGADQNSDDLIYSYVYDKEDHVIKKKIPGKDSSYYWYNTRDLLSASRDAILEDRSLWYTYQYDGLGREISSGFYNTAPGTSGSFSNLTPTEKLTENIYGTSAFEKDKLNTNRTKILDNGNWLEGTHTYNTCGTIQTSTSNNHLDLVKNDVTTLTYDGAHNVVSSSYLHSTPIKILTLANYNSYDHVGRPDSMSMDIDGTIYQGSTSQYSHKEELLSHRTGIPGANVLQQSDYTYRNNGMLTDINIGTGSQVNDLFSFELQYDQAFAGTGATIRKNGDIINAVWTTSGGNQRIYSYAYDYLDRLTEATYKEQGRDNKYNTAYSYAPDQRGNLKTITREGYHLENGILTSGQIDNIDLNYGSGNQLSHILEYATGSLGTEGFLKSQSGFYDHDGNGNITREPNKMYDLHYNHLNLVDSIVFDDGKKYEFSYDATGGLLQKRIYLDAHTKIETHDYINGIEYINGDIESIYTPEGRIVNDGYFPDTLYVIDSIYGLQQFAAGTVISTGSVKDHPSTTEIQMLGENAVVLLPGFKVEELSEFIANIQNNSGAGWRSEYMVSDHLGNTRVVYSDLNGNQQITPDEIIQENHYYPFGLKQNGDWQRSKDAIAYGYNGMELLDEFGLDLNMTTYRMLDPSIGRWFSVDIDAEKFPYLSGYNSMLNSPVTLNDPNGDNPLLIGAAIGLVSNGIQNVSNGDGFLKGGFQAAFMGAWGGGVSAGIGANIGNEFVRAGAHALSSGAQSAGAGGSFWHGAASGGLSSGVGSVMGNSLGKAGQYVQGALTGGIGSSIAGGSFWKGAGQGLITAGLNHAAHLLVTDPCFSCPPGVKNSDLSPSLQMAVTEGWQLRFDDGGNIIGASWPETGEFISAERNISPLRQLADITILGSMRVPVGEYWVNLATGIGQKGGTFISKMAQYLKFNRGKTTTSFSKMTTSRGTPFTPPNVQPVAKSSWAKFWEALFGGFDSPK